MLHFKKFISVSGEFKGWAEQAYLGNLTGKLRFTWAACRQLWIARLLAESVCCQMCPLSQTYAPTCAVSGLFTCHAKEPSYNIQRAELKPSDKTFLTQWKLFTAATVRTFHNVFFFFFFKIFLCSTVTSFPVRPKEGSLVKQGNWMRAYLWRLKTLLYRQIPPEMDPTTVAKSKSNVLNGLKTSKSTK